LTQTVTTDLMTSGVSKGES